MLKNFHAVQKGMTRKEVHKRLRLERGIQGDPVRFTHPDCPNLKLDVTFAADGTVTNVSKPYLGWAFID